MRSANGRDITLTEVLIAEAEGRVLPQKDPTFCGKNKPVSDMQTADGGGQSAAPLRGPRATEVLVAIDAQIAAIRTLFHRKNAGYGKLCEPLANFYDSAPVTKGMLSPLAYCMTLCAKQDDAAWASLADPNDTRQAEFRERLMDGIVYRIIALVLDDEAERALERETKPD